MNLNLMNTPSNSAVATAEEQSQQIEIKRDNRYPLLLKGERWQGTETFGILRARLLQLCHERKIRSVIFTSAEKADGKTLVTANLALSLGELKDMRVLLIDGDLRLKNLSRLFRAEGTIGLCEMLAGTATEEDAIRQTSVKAVSFLPAGNAPEDTFAQLLQGGRWSELMAQLRRQYDLVLVDSVPANVPVADFELMSSAVEGIMMIVRIRQTHRDSLQAVAKLIPEEKLLGLVINNSSRPTRYMYTYYSR